MTLKLDGKIAVITGGSVGIGLATAKRFAAEGARVFITGRRQPELDRAISEIGQGATAVRADSGNLADLDRLYEQVKVGAGRVDIVFANAGGGSIQPLGEITEADVDAVFDGNVKGTIFTVQKALPLMTQGGSVILMSSIAGSLGLPGLSVYSASKAAIRNLARGWTADLKDRGIRVNVLSPGPVRTPGMVGLVGPDPKQQQAFVDMFAAQTPIGRVGDPDEIAKAAVFLASDDSSFVLGTELFVDGGQAQV